MNYLVTVTMLLCQMPVTMPMNYGIPVLTMMEQVLLGEVKRK